MAKLTRPTETKIFGSTALAAELTPFGSSIPSTDINLILNSTEAQRGWGTIGANGFPPMEWFNALGYGLSYYNAYLMQQGIPEWTALQDYYINSICIGSDGKIYRSISGVSGTPNSGNNPTTDTIKWEHIFKNYAPLASPSITGTPSINGVNLSPYSGIKNFLINGNFKVWQRGNGPFASGTQICTADRWVLTGSTGIGIRDVSVSGLRLYATVAGTYIGLQQRAEGGAQLSGKNVTISYERYTAIASPNASISIVFKKISDGTTLTTSIFELKNFGLTGAFVKETVTLSVPTFAHSPSDVMMEFNIGLTNATSATCDTTFKNIQIEEGNIATNFEERTEGLELLLCQRYYEKSKNNIQYFNAISVPSISNSYANSINFRTEKRNTPTITTYSPTGVAGKWSWYNTTNGVELTNTAEVISTTSATFRYGLSGYTLAIGGWTASSEL